MMSASETREKTSGVDALLEWAENRIREQIHGGVYSAILFGATERYDQEAIEEAQSKLSEEGYDTSIEGVNLHITWD